MSTYYGSTDCMPLQLMLALAATVSFCLWRQHWKHCGQNSSICRCLVRCYWNSCFLRMPVVRRIVKRLRSIVGQGVLNWSPKQLIDFATTCLANEVAGMWLDSWKMSRLIANTPFAFLQSVNSVHDLTLDTANTLILHCKHGESPNLVQHRIDSGRDVLTKTRELWLTTSARSATTTGQRILTLTFCPMSCITRYRDCLACLCRQ